MGQAPSILSQSYRTSPTPWRKSQARGRKSNAVRPRIKVCVGLCRKISQKFLRKLSGFLGRKKDPTSFEVEPFLLSGYAMTSTLFSIVA
jgi:hypothetical protein